MKDWSKAYINEMMEENDFSTTEKIISKKSYEKSKAKSKRQTSIKKLQFDYNVREEISLAAL